MTSKRNFNLALFMFIVLNPPALVLRIRTPKKIQTAYKFSVSAGVKYVGAECWNLKLFRVFKPLHE